MALYRHINFHKADGWTHKQGHKQYTVKPRLFEVPGTAGILSNNR